MKLLASATCVAAACVVALAWAEDLPGRKFGLWTLTVEAAGMPAQVTKYCIDAATNASMLPLKPPTPGSGPCTETNRSRSGDIISLDSVCTMGSDKTNSHFVVTMSGGLVERMESTSVLTSAKLGVRNGSMIMQWAGSCPADMQPGDMETPEGLKLNIISGTISKSDSETRH